MADLIPNIGDSEKEQVSLALGTLSRAPLSVLRELREQITTVTKEINRKLTEADGLPHALLLKSVSNSSKKIRAFVQKPETELLERKSAGDLRLTDIRQTRMATDSDLFLAFLGERSLALEKEKWERWGLGYSRVDSLVRNLDASTDRNGVVRQFMEFKGWSPDNKPLYRAILRGQKYLVNERLFPNSRGSSAIYAFKGRDFDRLHFKSLPLLYNQLSLLHGDIHSLAQNVSHNVDAWQDSYDKGANVIIQCFADGLRLGLPLDHSAIAPLLGVGRDGTDTSVRQIEISTIGDLGWSTTQTEGNYTQTPGQTSYVRQTVFSSLSDTYPVSQQNQDRAQQIHGTRNIPAREDHLLPSQRGTTARSSINDSRRSTTGAQSSPSSPLGRYESDPSDYDYRPHSEGNSDGSEMTSPQTNQRTDNFRVLVDAAETYAKQMNKRPYLADNSSQCRVSQRRRLNEEIGGNGLADYGSEITQTCL
ncbi:hypothetical protein MauCBS54593_000031 [Microsporum audouinii]